MNKTVAGLLLLTLAGCQSAPQPYQPLRPSLSAYDLFDVTIPRVALTNATIDVALDVVREAWARIPQMRDAPPLVAWKYAEREHERLITIKATDIPVGQYLVLLSKLSPYDLTFDSGAVIFDQIPPWISDVYQTTFESLPDKTAEFLGVSDATTADELMTRLESYGIHLQIRFWDAHERWMIATGFPEDQVAFAGLSRLVETGVKIEKRQPQQPDGTTQRNSSGEAADPAE